MNIIFAGTPEFAAVALRALLNTPHLITAVLTQPDRPRGRGQKRAISPVKLVAQHAGISVLQPEKLTPDVQAQLMTQHCDIMIVAAYGLMIPAAVLQWPRLGCINIHASLLPRWRGAAPIQRALLAGDTETGITLMQMDAGLDTGAMLVSASIPISNKDTSTSLHDRLAKLGANLLCDSLASLSNGNLTPIVQDEQLATYASKLTKAEGNITWSDSAVNIDRHIRGLTPWPGCFTFLNERRIKILEATQDAQQLGAFDQPGQIIDLTADGLGVATGEGLLRISQLQPEGAKAMSARDALNGNPHWLATPSRFRDHPSHTPILT